MKRTSGPVAGIFLTKSADVIAVGGDGDAPLRYGADMAMHPSYVGECPGICLDCGFGCLRSRRLALAAQSTALLVSGNPQLTEGSIPMIFAGQ